MLMDGISWYVETLTAFWVSLASGGLFKLIFILLLVRWIFGGRRRWGGRGYRHGHCSHGHGHSQGHCSHSHGHGHGDCHGHRCQHCGCRCGYCPCGAGEEAGDDKAGDDKAGDDDASEAV